MGVEPVDHAGRWAPLADWRFLLATSVLILNDRWLKAAWPGLITGKLSDFAGPVVLAVVLAALLAGLGRQRSRRVAVAATMLLMLGIKVSPAAANAVAGVLETLTGMPSRIVADPADLVGLVALFVVKPVVDSPQALLDRRWLPIAGLMVALYATVATGAIDQQAHNELGTLDDGQVVAIDSEGYADLPTELRRTDDGEWIEINLTSEASDFVVAGSELPYCLESDAAICVRADGNFVLSESQDGGANWSTVFDIDPTEGWLEASNPDILNGTSVAGPGQALELRDGSLIVALGELGPVTRSTDGTWSPSDTDQRVFPFLEWLLVAASVGIAVPAVVLIARARGRRSMLVPGILSLPLMLPMLGGAGLFWLGDDQLDLLLGFIIVVGVPALALAALLQIIGAAETIGTEETGPSTVLFTYLLTIGAVVAGLVPLSLWRFGLVGWPFARWALIVLTIVSTIAAVLIAGRRPFESEVDGHQLAL